MSKTEISEKVCQLIFEKIDSVEQLDVLLILRSLPERSWSAEMLANELRSNSKSASTRLTTLVDFGLIESDKSKSGFYRYKKQSIEMENTIGDLAEDYKIRRQKVLELIFSPVKKARHFANAFMVTKPDRKGDSDG